MIKPLSLAQDLNPNEQDDAKSSKSSNSYLESNKLNELYLKVHVQPWTSYSCKKKKSQVKTYIWASSKNRQRIKIVHVPLRRRLPQSLTNGGKVSLPTSTRSPVEGTKTKKNSLFHSLSNVGRDLIILQLEPQVEN